MRTQICHNLELGATNKNLIQILTRYVWHILKKIWLSLPLSNSCVYGQHVLCLFQGEALVCTVSQPRLTSWSADSLYIFLRRLTGKISIMFHRGIDFFFWGGEIKVKYKKERRDNTKNVLTSCRTLSGQNKPGRNQNIR